MKYTGSEEGRTKLGHWRYLSELRELARSNRFKMTRAEAKLWYEFLSLRPEGFKFTRQKPIGRFIADFYCSQLLLVIEVDGKIHEFRKNYDEVREIEMERRGIKTIRFNNNEIMNNLTEVKNKINLILKSPLSRGRSSETRQGV